MKLDPHALFAVHVMAKRLPKPNHEFRFDKVRRWRLDVAWPAVKVAVELHGGVYRSGRHTRGKGFTEDRRKMNAATEQGWRVFEFTTEQVESGEAIRVIERVLCPREAA